MRATKSFTRFSIETQQIVVQVGGAFFSRAAGKYLFLIFALQIFHVIDVLFSVCDGSLLMKLYLVMKASECLMECPL